MENDKQFIELGGEKIEVKNLRSTINEPEKEEDSIEKFHPDKEFTKKIIFNDANLKNFLTHYEENMLKNFFDKLIKGFYESHSEWFKDMPYPVAKEYISVYFNFTDFRVEDDAIIINPKWKPPEQVIEEDIDTPLLDEWIKKRMMKNE